MAETPSPAARYTHGHHRSVLSAHARRSAASSAAYLLPELSPGQSLLDVGCGPGTITLDLARAVAPGPVTGIDPSPAAVEAAAAATGPDDPPVTWRTGDVMALDVEGRSQDVVHAHQVLQHLADPVGALREMARVCRPDGLVAVRDADYGAMVWYPHSEGLEDWMRLYQRLARLNGAEPDAGRRLVAWANAAGLTDVRPSTGTWTYATDVDRTWWATSWAERATASAFADQALEAGLATRDDLDALAAAWLAWAADPDAWFCILHGEVLARP